MWVIFMVGLYVGGMRDIPPIFSAMFKIASVDNLRGLSIFIVDCLWVSFSSRRIRTRAVPNKTASLRTQRPKGAWLARCRLFCNGTPSHTYSLRSKIALRHNFNNC